ncbi:uncharacterized protein LOC119730164 [Patiria miniata]|uniref:Ig-like domain-containing protein n=1 Tax=Patiria miniata TaxID=46514 RepID=A0A914A4Z0_PATMI|nr:uncharacterized protein LOC119730164 [Patiria miniata]
MKEFVCVAGLDFNTGPRCSVTPLQIPTRVSISPTFQSVYEGDSAVFTCNVRAIPPLTDEEYRWRIYKTDESEVTVTGATLTSFDGRYNMMGNTLEILAVSADFHNSYVACTVVYPQGSSNSIYKSVLTVLSVTTVLSATSSTATTTVQSPIGVLIGGVLALLLLLVVIVLLASFLLRYKRKVRRLRQTLAGNPVQISAIGSSEGTDLTYQSLQKDIGNQRATELMHMDLNLQQGERNQVRPQAGSEVMYKNLPRNDPSYPDSSAGRERPEDIAENETGLYENISE